MIGCDISNWQGVGAGDGYDFVIIKATEGYGYVDPKCDQHYQRAKANGQLRGVYHFARPDLGNSAVTEADWFVDNIQGYIKDAVLVLDWECSTWNVGWAKEWLDRVYSRTGVRPMIYMSASVISQYNWNDVVNGNYGLWIAGYPAQYDVPNPPTPDCGDMPYNIGPWPFWAIWQYTSCAGAFDKDISGLDATAWAKYAGYYQEPKPEPTPEPTPEPEPTPTPEPEPEPDPVPDPTPQPDGSDPTPAKKNDLKEYEKAMKKLQKKGVDMPFTLPARVYECLRWGIAIVLPAIGLFLELLNNVWNWGLPMDAIKTTLNGVAIFIGTIFCISYTTNKKSNE